MANVHPWFGGVNIADAAGWTWEFFEENDVVVAEAATVSYLRSLLSTIFTHRLH